MNVKIKKIEGMRLIDSRGNPTVAATVTLEDGSVGFAISPSGASTGGYEAYELRDTDKKAFFGRDVARAVEGINGEINKALCGMNCANQMALDKALITLDGTENKSRLGANAILAVSLACA